MQTIYIGNSLLGDDLAIAQQLISDILTCLGRLCRQRRPYRGASCRPYGGGKRCPIEAPHWKRNLAPY